LFATLNNIGRAQADRRISVLADLLNLSAVMDLQVRTCSTGTVHRLSLARALLHEPSVLVLDEPTRSLDPLAAAEFRRFLRDEVVKCHGTTLLFASHSLAEVEQLAGRMAVLHAGRLLAFDTPERLREAAGALTLEQSMGVLVRRACPAS
jgi:ABC-2 type transport system ATP-binding protein